MVIQRWQSLLLLVAAVMMGCFTFMSLGQVQMPDYTLNFTTMGFAIEGIPTDGAKGGMYLTTWALFIVSLMSMIIPFIDIFLFKNLRLQRMLCLIELLFVLGVAGTCAVYGYHSLSPYCVSWSSLAIAPIIAFVATYLAYRRIGKDQRTLQSAYRIR